MKSKPMTLISNNWLQFFFYNLQVGLVGLVEQEWIDTLATVDPEDIIFHDFVVTGNQLAAELREQVGYLGDNLQNNCTQKEYVR